MSATVTWTHRIVEGDANPLDIPARPVPVEPRPEVRFRRTEQRLLTWEALIGPAGRRTTIGYVRWDTSLRLWIGRTTGGARHTALIETFSRAADAARWLLDRVLRLVEQRRARAWKKKETP